MKKGIQGTVSIWLVILVVAVAIGLGYFGFRNSDDIDLEQVLEIREERVAIIQLVESFGSKVNNVSKLQPEEDIKKAIQENYSSFISQELLEKWLANPKKAPGRTTSSPWPDRIEVLAVYQTNDSEHKVDANLIWKTSTGESKQSIYITVIKDGGKWLISNFELQPQTSGDETAGWQTYRNEKYGFEFKYPPNYFIHNINPKNPQLEFELVIDKNSPDSLKSPAAEFWPFGSFVIQIGNIKNLETVLYQEKNDYSQICSQYSNQLSGRRCPYSYKQSKTTINGAETIVTNPIDENPLEGIVFNQDQSFKELRYYYFKGKQYFYKLEENYQSSFEREDNKKIFSTFNPL